MLFLSEKGGERSKHGKMEMNEKCEEKVPCCAKTPGNKKQKELRNVELKENYKEMIISL